MPRVMVPRSLPGRIQMKTIIAVSLMLVMGDAAAFDEFWIDLNLHAHHWNRTDVREQNLNEVNPGIGLRFVDNNFHKLIGVYKNSVRKTSVYALMAWTPLGTESVRIGAVAGAVTGYAKPYVPAAGAYVVVKPIKNISVNITMVPTVRSIQCYGFAGFQLSAKF